MFSTSREFTIDRRAFLGRYAGCLGGLALAELLCDHAPSSVAAAQSNPRAKAVICLFQHGGPSQMDLFDPKPELARRHGEAYPGELEVHFNKQQGKLLSSPFKFSPSGDSGIELSELLPHTAAIADDLTLVRSMTTESVDHEAALRLIHSGKIQAGRPAWGSWVTYALGAANRDLPSYVVLSDPGGL